MSANVIASVRIIDAAVIDRERRMGRIVELAAKLLDIRESRRFGEAGADREREFVYSSLAMELALLRK